MALNEEAARRAIAARQIEVALLRRGVAADVASVEAERNAERVAVGDDLVADVDAMRAVVAEVVERSGRTPDPNGAEFYEELRRTLAATRERERQEQERRRASARRLYNY